MQGERETKGFHIFQVLTIPSLTDLSQVIMFLGGWMQSEFQHVRKYHDFAHLRVWQS